MNQLRQRVGPGDIARQIDIDFRDFGDATASGASDGNRCGSGVAEADLTTVSISTVVTDWPARAFKSCPTADAFTCSTSSAARGAPMGIPVIPVTLHLIAARTAPDRMGVHSPCTFRSLKPGADPSVPSRKREGRKCPG